MFDFEHLLLEIIRILGCAIILLIALMGFELYLMYKEKKDRDGL